MCQLNQQVGEILLPTEIKAGLNIVRWMLENFFRRLASEDAGPQDQPFKGFREVECNLIRLCLHQLIDFFKLRTECRPIRNHEDTIRGTIDQLGKNIGFSLG